MTRSTRALLAVLAFLPSATVRAQHTRPAPPGIIISKETTRILSPLRPDGFPDYIAAYNGALPKIPLDKNAAAFLLRAVGTQAIDPDPAVQRATLKLLAMDPTTINPAKSLQELDLKHLPNEYEALRLVMRDYLNQTQFDDDQRRALTDWFNAHPAIMENLERAAACEFFALPLAIKDSRDSYTGYSVNLHLVLAGSLLPARAAVFAAAGKNEQALQDLRAAIKLARLLQQSTDISLYGFGCLIEGRAFAKTRLLATTYRFDQADLRALAHDIAALPVPNMAAAFDVGGRYALLDRLCALARGEPDRTLKQLYDMLPGEPRPDAGDLQQADINLLLRLTNEDWDRFIATLSIRNPQELLRKRYRDYAAAPPITSPLPVFTITAAGELDIKSVDAFNAFRLKRNQEVADFVRRRKEESVEHYTRRVYEILRCHPKTYFIFEGGQVLNSVEQPLTVTTLALAAWYADHREYPETLESLVPKYLASLPADPFTGRRLVYHKTTKGFALYSLGYNGVDDHGRRDGKTGVDDISFTAASPH